jgi:hypothetical protein
MALTSVQKMLSLAFLADLDAGEIKGSVCDYAAKVAPKIKLGLDLVNLLGETDYEIVWGPAVFTFNFGGIIPTFSDNLLYVVHDRAHPDQYVIATSGTDNFSIADWVLEDFWTGNTVPWPYGAVPSQPRISVSSLLGLMILQTIVPCPDLPGQGTTLGAFVTSTVAAEASPITITTTGHSLGGSLSPLMALWLRDTQGTDNVAPRDQWDPNATTTLIAYSYAGATSGDANWAQHFDDRFDAEHAFRCWNMYDIVPYVWDVKDIAKIPTLYGTPADPSIQKIADNAIAAVQGLDYRQFHADTPPLPNAMLIPTKSFWLQVAYQHIIGYFVGVGLLPPAWLIAAVEDLGAPAAAG